MQNYTYPSAFENFKAGTLDWIEGTFFVALLNDQYKLEPVKHCSLVDVPRASFVTAPVLINNKSIVDGKAVADDVLFTSVEKGQVVTQLLIYAAGARRSDSLLVGLVTTGNGLPTKTNGYDVFIEWQRDGNRIFSFDKPEGKDDE